MGGNEREKQGRGGREGFRDLQVARRDPSSPPIAEPPKSGRVSARVSAVQRATSGQGKTGRKEKKGSRLIKPQKFPCMVFPASHSTTRWRPSRGPPSDRLGVPLRK